MGVIHVCRPVATVRIELAPCLGLDSDGVVSGHALVRLVETIIGTAIARIAAAMDSSPSGFIFADSSTQTPLMGVDRDAMGVIVWMN